MNTLDWADDVDFEEEEMGNGEEEFEYENESESKNQNQNQNDNGDEYGAEDTAEGYPAEMQRSYRRSGYQYGFYRRPYRTIRARYRNQWPQHSQITKSNLITNLRTLIPARGDEINDTNPMTSISIY